MKKTFFIFSIFLILTAFNIEKEVKTFGFYSNEKSNDGEHSKGYILQLWKYKNTLIGKISYNEGLIGNQISSYVFNVKYNEEKGILYFESTLDGEKIKFNGKISKSKTFGTYTWPSKIDKNQSMKICCDDAPINIDYQTLNEWKKMWEEFEN